MSMLDIASLDDLALLRESVSLECKLAAGRDGKGALPEDFWPTYSAMANSDGGLVILGVREQRGKFQLEGIEDIGKVRAELFNSLNNRQKVSVNLLCDKHIREQPVDGKILMLIEIPRASRQQRPVYLGQNPFGGNAYRRLNDGDRPLSDENVRRMLAEQVEDSRDDQIQSGYDLNDLDMESLRAYRQVFANRDPGHPWNEINDRAFLHMIGGWREDRETGDAGLTLAGLLMFGRMSAIHEALPYYMLDYQERAERKTDMRWTDRLTLDGRWSGNLYDFYRKVYLKLTADLKIPFVLENGERKDETPVHVALREALANVLVHADYTDRASVLVVKHPDMFGFRNPGLMRIPVEIALQGGEPDCRNRNLHKMFRFVGVGEQAGTGIPRIFQGWKSQHWSPPKLYESSVPYNQTRLELRMIDLFPAAVMAGLRARFGKRFELLKDEECVALALAGSEGTVNHARLCTVTDTHPVDLTRILQGLTRAGMLESQGSGRGAVYFLPGQHSPKPEDVFGQVFSGVARSSVGLEGSSVGLEGSSVGLEGSSVGLEPERDTLGRIVSEHLELPIIDSLAALSTEWRQQLEIVAGPPRKKKRLSRDRMEETLLELCKDHYLTLQVIAELVDRNPDFLRVSYLSPLLQAKKIAMAFPTTPTHEKQAYCLSQSLSGSEATNPGG